MKPRPLATLHGLALALLLAAAASCALAEGRSVNAQGAALYQRNCAACHGERGDGDSRARKALAKEPRDFTTELARQALPRDYMIAIVRDGKHEAPMVGRKSRLSQVKIETIVDFIRTSIMPPEPGSARALGRALYLETCASCHGDRGQGGQIQHRQSSSPQLSLKRSTGTLTRDELLAAIAREIHAKRQGNTLPGFGTQLSASDREAVVDYMRSAFFELGSSGKTQAPASAKQD